MTRLHQRYYLEDMPLDTAVDKFNTLLDKFDGRNLTNEEDVMLNVACGRVTATPVWARLSSPHYDSAGMDGIAVKSRDTIGATETTPVILKLHEQAVWIDTGDPMPEGFDAVVMIELVHELSECDIEIQSSVTPYQNVRALGEDIAATELILPIGHRLRPQDLAACASAGLDHIKVRCRPIVTILPTGDELIPVGNSPKPSEIIESNGLMLSAMVEEWGATAHLLEPVSDDLDLLKSLINTTVDESDVLLVNAGSSAGSEDYTATAVEDLGQLVVHGIAIRPGHPVVLGVVNKKPVIGIPGYPVSAAITNQVIVKPLIEHMLGAIPSMPHSLEATISRKTASPIGEEEFVRVRLGRVREKLVATPLQRGAGVITSMVRADGIVTIPRFSEGLAAGSTVNVNLLRSPHELDRAILVVGSHDMTLDLLASEIRSIDSTITISSSNVGSVGGLLALGRGEAHLSGCHLLDEDTGEYNVSFVDRYITDRVVIVNLVHRIQGLMVKRGNPKTIKTLDDLGRADVFYVNRQRGSGTRMLLDYMLKISCLETINVAGYDREEYTHLAVAAAIAGGSADTGLGILSAARATGLDFVPLQRERYDLVIPNSVYQSELVSPVIQLIRSKEFRSKVNALGGYDVSDMGEIIKKLPSEVT